MLLVVEIRNKENYNTNAYTLKEAILYLTNSVFRVLIVQQGNPNRQVANS
jgi:hypothetical protein